MLNSLPGVAENLSRIQSLTDELAHELGRSVEVDTPSFEVVCASAQIGVIDNRRIASIIHRAPPPEPVPWILSHGVRTATQPVRLPANPTFEMLPRVCFPVRRDGELCAYLWLFDEPRLTDTEITRVCEFLTPLAALFAHDDGVDERARLLDSLANGILQGNTDALDRARSGGFLPDDGRLTLHVIRFDIHPDADRAGRLQLELSRLHRNRPFLTTLDSGTLVAVERSRSTTDTEAVWDEVRRAAIVSGMSVEAIGSAGIAETGRVQAALRRARFMTEVATLPGIPHSQMSWEHAGAWRLLLGWELNETAVHTISDDASRLLFAGDRSYWPTVLAYLNNGRNTNRTATELFIHRATLHYRLERAREIIGEQALGDGWRAASLQVALQLHAALNAQRDA